MGTNIKGIKNMTLHLTHNQYSFLIRDSHEDPSNDHNLDFKIINETWVENVYRIHDWQFSSPGIFVDIGANIGAVSLFVDNFNSNRDRGSKIRVFAVEPEPNNIALLKDNIANNPVERITVVENAMWYEDKLVPITQKGGNSSIINLNNENYIEVSAITLETFFNKYNIKEVDVMKIDVEGAEFDLIINTPAETLAKIKRLVLEFDKSFDGSFGKMVEKLAKQFGIEILGSPERGGYIYANRY
jgi:FkbM family methyltransferase